MKTAYLLMVLCFASPLFGEQVEALIERLPQLRKQVLKQTEALRNGSTVEMVEAGAMIRDVYLPPLVRLEVALTKQSTSETSKTIERDLEAIAKDAHIRGHASGWGGTIVKVESAIAVVEHLEARISWCVWQLMQDHKDFGLDQWLERWQETEETTSQPTR